MSIWYEGEAADGTHVLFTADPYTQRANCTLFVNHEEVEIKSAERFRDGGTTVVHTALGKFYKPSLLGSRDTKTTFDGKVLKAVDRINHTIKKNDLNRLLQRMASTLTVPPLLSRGQQATYRIAYEKALDDIRKELNL